MALPTRTQLLSLDYSGLTGPSCLVEAKTGINTLSLDRSDLTGVFVGAAVEASNSAISAIGPSSIIDIDKILGVSIVDIGKILGVDV